MIRKGRGRKGRGRIVPKDVAIVKMVVRTKRTAANRSRDTADRAPQAGGGTLNTGDIQRRFGERLREIRKGKGFSQEGLAMSCNLDRAYIGGVERGERNISLINIYKIARGLDISAKVLMP